MKPQGGSGFLLQATGKPLGALLPRRVRLGLGRRPAFVRMNGGCEPFPDRMTAKTRPIEPTLLQPAYEDPDAVWSLVEAHAPYWSIQRYVASEAEMEAVSRERNRGRVSVIPWFRGDWAYGAPLVRGAERVLQNPPFIEAAREAFDAEVVRPLVVYVNLMAPMPIAGEGHIDVPSFRGFDRTRHPVWLLQAMGRSGLFRRWQIDQATAVSWFYEGEKGEFDYWADGIDAPPRSVTGLTNKAVVGDNDFMFHRVREVGRGAGLPEGLSLDTELRYGGGGAWEVATGNTVHCAWPGEKIRVSVSWKAEVFASAAEARERDDHSDDLMLDTVIDHFQRALDDRGLGVGRSENNIADPEFIAAVSEAFPLPDLVYPTQRETDHRRRR